MKRSALLCITCFLCSCAEHIDYVSVIERQMSDFPQSHLQDIYKSFYQEYFGAEHLITDTASVSSYLHNEVIEALADSVLTPYYEPTGAEGRFVRVYLRCITEGLIEEERLLSDFIASAKPQTNATTTWESTWEQITAAVNQMENPPLDWEIEMEMLIQYSKNNQAVRHSAQYRNAYHPHYRIVRKELFDRNYQQIK